MFEKFTFKLVPGEGDTHYIGTGDLTSLMIFTAFLCVRSAPNC